ncbi:hypothetical protein IQ235_07775 [Oscillatoriales cyanobacterium LEGE 11467]|uniref:Uncharacterized protein n=1 Tax=Zarconia navalis LEGE 11467 TaxID=1828826 RepID=A0A928VUW6_9CYAN|nr:hypothetical protein [Zarconia navalis]MBE9040677.1 hypothetical protein [Zarconia navalis LEGE 11467]
MGSGLPTHHFFYGGLICAVLLILIHFVVCFVPKNPPELTFDRGLWHEHEHAHDENR